MGRFSGTRIATAFFLPVCAAGLAGCHSKAVDKQEFRSALDHYYSEGQACIFNPEIKLPAQADTGNEEETKDFDALTDAGLLQRTPAEKKRFLIGSKQVNDYDLSEQGRTHWTADATQPGYGNFCLGSPAVQSIDNFTPAASGEEQYSVTYTYALKLPDWANTTEIKTAFPRIAQESAGQSATATLSHQPQGWQVGNVTSSRGAPLPQ
jgi:hypothetical protein